MEASVHQYGHPLMAHMMLGMHQQYHPPQYHPQQAPMEPHILQQIMLDSAHAQFAHPLVAAQPSSPPAPPSTPFSALDLCVRKRARDDEAGTHTSSPPPSPPTDLSKADIKPFHPSSHHHHIEHYHHHNRPESPRHTPPSVVTPPLQNVMEPPTSTMYFSSPGSQSHHSHSSGASSGGASDADIPDFASITSGSTNTNNNNNLTSPSNSTNKVKIPRPFKAYPKDPLAMAVGIAATKCVIGASSDGAPSEEAYSQFRSRMLSQVQATNGNGTNKNMRRTNVGSAQAAAVGGSGGGAAEPTKYLEMRRKNNAAAKRSRDARRAKEDEIAIRCAFLEQENLKLRYEVSALKNESERLRGIIAYSN